jgi:hypothetical protein
MRPTFTIPEPESGGLSLEAAGAAMRRNTRLLFLCAVNVSLWLAAVAGAQTGAPVELSRALRDYIKDGRFGIVTSIRGLPLGVRDALQTLFGRPTLDIVEPGAAFQITGVNGDVTLPIRRLVAAGCTVEYCLVYYERGVPAHTWHVALFHWTPAATRFEWGGSAPGGLTTFDDVRNAVLSGAIRGAADVW